METVIDKISHDFSAQTARAIMKTDSPIFVQNFLMNCTVTSTRMLQNFRTLQTAPARKTYITEGKEKDTKIQGAAVKIRAMHKPAVPWNLTRSENCASWLKAC
jgi:hypothetical protein